MSRREEPSSPEIPAKLKLPESGLASEILGALGLAPQAAAAEPAEAPEAPSGTAFTGRNRVYTFSDSLYQASGPAAIPERPESWVTFELKGEVYALPVSHMQEILRITTITRIPHAPFPVRGITNLRGKVLAVVDLRVRLGIAAVEPTEKSRILVVASQERSLGLLVDSALQVVKLLPSAIQPAPTDVLTERSDFLRGVYHLEEKLLILLDVDRVLLVQEGLETAASV